MLNDENEKKNQFKKKRLKSNQTNFQNPWPGLPHRRQTQKNHEAKFSIIQKKKKQTHIAINRMRTKSNIKIKWNKTMRDKIKK
jgi:hypothetical protein